MKYLLFDLDGTLTDPGEGITNAVRYALERFGLRVEQREELYPYIGPPLTDSFQRYHGLTPEQAQQALAWYREYYADTGIYENVPYPGVAAFLAGLQQEGYTLLVATSKPEEFAARILQHYGLERYFAFVGGNDLQESRPDKAAVIAHVRRQYPALTAANALMIGDREYDVAGAAENGLRTVGVLYGYGSLEELQRAGAGGGGRRSAAAGRRDPPAAAGVIVHSLFANRSYPGHALFVYSYRALSVPGSPVRRG